jgi:membrane dipeptidase
VTATEQGISAKAAALHESAIVIDTLSFYYDGPSERMIPSQLTALNLTACETYSNWARGVEEIMQVREDMKEDPTSVLIRSAADIEAAKRDGKVGIILGVQSTLFIESEIQRLQLLHDIGLRIIQLTYNERSYMGDGCLEKEDGGLSRFGKRAIAEMARLGIAVDLSHVARRTSVEAIYESPVPVMFTHSNPDAITRNPRNLIEEQIKAIGERRGMIGLCAWAPLLWKNNPAKQPDIDDLVDHVDYLVDKIGIDYVGVGTDSACTGNKAWLIQHSLEFNTAYPEIAVEYFSHHPRDNELPQINSLVRLTDGLLRRGYKDEDVLKVIGGNFLRHFREVWHG